jgi:hypothetical protein
MDSREAHQWLLYSYGTFMVMWSVFDTVLMMVILRENGLTVKEAIAKLSPMETGPKIREARNALSKKPENARAVALIDEIEQIANRNALVHGAVFDGAHVLEFVKRDRKSPLALPLIRTFDVDAFKKLLVEVNGRVSELHSNLGITDGDIIAFGEELKRAHP